MALRQRTIAQAFVALLAICAVTSIFYLALPRAMHKPFPSLPCRACENNSGHLFVRGIPVPRLIEGQVKMNWWREAGRVGIRGPTAHLDAVPTPQQTARPMRTDVVFLKTHKTASSTFQNILFRFGEKHKLTFAFPISSYQFRYPLSFKASYVAPLPPGATGGRFHILCSHMRLNVSEVSRVMSRNATYMSIVRRPERAFESVFYYYQSIIPAFIAAKKMSKSNDSLQIFLENPEKFYNASKKPPAYVKNPMSFDFGLDSNDSVLSDRFRTGLAQLDATFDLVMITERFDESVILAKELLGWQMSDVVFLSMNKRAKTQRNNIQERYDSRLYDMIRRWNALDVALYEHFSRRFQRQVEAFGLERMQREMDALHEEVRARREECVASEVVAKEMKQKEIMPFAFRSVDILGYNMKSDLDPPTYERCLRLLLPELKYHTRLFQRQYGSTVEQYRRLNLRNRERHRKAP